MANIILYGNEGSPPTRAVKLTLDTLGLSYEYKVTLLFEGAHLTEEFKRKNPQHTVPVLEVDGHCLWESHAIMAFLVTQYGKTDSLYPKEPFLRAKVDQRLHFESGVLFQGCMRNIALPVLFNNQEHPEKKLNPFVSREKINAVYEAYDFLEAFLENNNYMCGSDITIADFSIISTVSSFEVLAPIDPEKHPKLTAWVERMKQLPNYQETNGNGAERLIYLFNTYAKLES